MRSGRVLPFTLSKCPGGGPHRLQKVHARSAVNLIWEMSFGVTGSTKDSVNNSGVAAGRLPHSRKTQVVYEAPSSQPVERLQ